MVGPLHGALSSLLVYLALCAVATAAGRGLLRLLSLRPAASLLFAPVLALVLWSLALGIAVALRVPIKVAAPWLWAGTAVLAVNGLRGPRSDLRASAAPLALCAALPLVVMLPYFRNGLSDYVGSILPDGWSYVAAAQYLWERARGADGTPVLLHQYAQHLSDARSISFSLLGFLSPLVAPGDPQSVSGLYQAWTLFSAAAAVATFAVGAGLRRWMVLAVTLLATCSGWIANLVWANNFDNALALVYMPALAATARLGDVGGWRWSIFRGGLVAGVFYSYPELAPAIVAGAALITMPWAWRERRGWRPWLGEVARAGLIAAMLLFPGAPTLVSYLPRQISAAAASDRPGQGMFDGLLAPRFQPAAFWGLGGEHQLGRRRIERNLVGTGLSLLAIAGLVALAKRREWGLVALVALLSLGAIYLLIAERYAYGAYKLLVLGWWGLAIALVAGAEHLVTWARRRPLRWGLAAAAALLLVSLPLERHTDQGVTARYLDSPSRPLSMEQFRRVQDIGKIVGRNLVVVGVDDWVASEWAVYYLRDLSIRLAVLRMYMAMPHVTPLMQRGPPIDPAAIRYVLADEGFAASAGSTEGWTRRWASPPFTLWERSGPAAKR